MSLVRARKNPIMGAVVVADIVAKSELAGNGSPPAMATLKKEILETCQRSLARHKVPAAIRFVPSLDVASSGKLARLNA
jgi:acyl-coenzyme A synthetase/AMP-(fatty) acid ligase